MRILNLQPGVPSFVKVAVLQHHERLDGSGYPRGPQVGTFHPVAQIVAMVEMYLDLASPPPWQASGTPPHQALEAVMAGSAPRSGSPGSLTTATWPAWTSI